MLPWRRRTHKDETVKIVKEYGGNIYVRKNIENRRRKGYALDECLKNILKKVTI